MYNLVDFVHKPGELQRWREHWVCESASSRSIRCNGVGQLVHQPVTAIDFPQSCEAVYFVKLSALFYFLSDIDITLSTSWVISMSSYCTGKCCILCSAVLFIYIYIWWCWYIHQGTKELVFWFHTWYSLSPWCAAVMVKFLQIHVLSLDPRCLYPSIPNLDWLTNSIKFTNLQLLTMQEYGHTNCVVV